MSTINNWDIVQSVIEANGQPYPDEPPVVLIYEYENRGGRKAWKLIYGNIRRPPLVQYQEFIASPYVREPRCIFRIKL